MGKTNKQEPRGDWKKHDEHKAKKRRRHGKPKEENRELRDMIRKYK